MVQLQRTAEYAALLWGGLGDHQPLALLLLTPTYLPTYLSTYLPTYLPTLLSTLLTYIHTYTHTGRRDQRGSGATHC